MKCHREMIVWFWVVEHRLQIKHDPPLPLSCYTRARSSSHVWSLWRATNWHAMDSCGNVHKIIKVHYKNAIMSNSPLHARVAALWQLWQSTPSTEAFSARTSNEGILCICGLNSPCTSLGNHCSWQAGNLLPWETIIVKSLHLWLQSLSFSL